MSETLSGFKACNRFLILVGAANKEFDPNQDKNLT
jgi:hypothetical protein